VHGQTYVNFFTVSAISFVSEALRQADLATDKPHRLRNDSETQKQQAVGCTGMTESLGRCINNQFLN